MTFSRRASAFLFVFAGLCLAPLPGVSAAATRARPTRPAAAIAGGYKGAIIMDAATGAVLFEDQADLVSAPASMTKLMTFAVLDDLLRAGTITLATPIRITPEDANMGGSQVYLDPRETFSVEELIYAMMVQSANDAAHALARGSAGSVEAFVERMNAKAHELGMTHTTFVSPHGLPPATRKLADGDLTTPRDFALLSRYLLLKTDVLKYTSVRQRSFGGTVRKKPIDMVNHDNLLGKVTGVDGLKTGFTNGAGYCLAATAQRNGRRVIVVTMGGETYGKRDAKVIELLERGFALLPPNGAPFAASRPTLKTGAEAPVTLAPEGNASGASAGSSTSAPAGEPSMMITVPGKKK
jgi:D-alanyl-D-alanine carboxypeptidase (penicillin-binding protein 5/6)